jgi:branched-chain amino acid transport system permease protein
MVVLFRATGVLNLSFGAVGAMGALIAWQAINHWGLPQGIAWLICILYAAVVTAADRRFRSSRWACPGR